MQHETVAAPTATAGPPVPVPHSIDIARLRAVLCAGEPDEQFLVDVLLTLPAGLVAINHMQTRNRWPDAKELAAMAPKGANGRAFFESIPLASVIVGKFGAVAAARESKEREEQAKRTTRSRCNNAIALLAAGVLTDRAVAIAGVEVHELDAALAGRAPWSLATDATMVERGRGLLAAHEAERAKRQAAAVAASPAGRAVAMREAVDRVGFSEALATDAGRAWLKAADGAEETAPNGKPFGPKISFVMASHQTLGCWPDGLTVPDDAADALARAAVHIDIGLGSSLLAHATGGSGGGALFGPSATALVQAGCPAKLAAATAAWSLALVNAARPLLAVNRRASDRKLKAPSEMDLMAAARGRAHLEYATSRAGWPAVAAALWCAPVELSELWHFLADVMEPATASGSVDRRAARVEARRAELDRVARQASAWAVRAWGSAAESAVHHRRSLAPPPPAPGGF